MHIIKDIFIWLWKVVCDFYFGCKLCSFKINIKFRFNSESIHQLMGGGFSVSLKWTWFQWVAFSKDIRHISSGMPMFIFTFWKGKSFYNRVIACLVTNCITEQVFRLCEKESQFLHLKMAIIMQAFLGCCKNWMK